MNRQEYWNNYYKNPDARVMRPRVPSQFGAFVASEFISEGVTIVEFGCGDGRDSLFFASHGVRTIGVDASSSAIEICNWHSPENATFICSDIDNPDLINNINYFVSGGRVIVYARFFLHAIDEKAEESFLTLIRGLCDQTGAAAVEFRTNRDEPFAKVTPAHYRRFIDPLDFLFRAQSAGFRSTYLVEGFGFAKFRRDDAHVARCILRPAGSLPMAGG